MAELWITSLLFVTEMVFIAEMELAYRSRMFEQMVLFIAVILSKRERP